MIAIRAELARAQVQFKFREADNVLKLCGTLHPRCLPERRLWTLPWNNQPGNKRSRNQLTAHHFLKEQKGHANFTCMSLTRAPVPSTVMSEINFKETSMTSSVTPLIAAVVATAAIMIPTRIQGQLEQSSHHHYKFVDLGTFGGPKSGVNGEPSVQVINNVGTVVGVADTSILTPVAGGFNPIGNPDFFISHAFVWRGGSLKDLGTLPGGDYSFAAAINQFGQITGTSENGQIDPASGNPEFHAVLWENDKIHDLGTLGGTASFATVLNDHSQVIGEALNSVPDPLSILGLGDGTTLAQTRAFLWERGKMHDLGTLGGPDSWAMFVNDRGQVAGTSYTTDVVDHK